MPAEALKKPDEGAMARILARHPYSPEGVILRLAWQEGLSRKELNELTWDQVDLDGGSILLPDRTVPLEPSVADCLRERYARYRKLSNRVLIADRGKKPMTPENVSRLAKIALDSEGQDVSLKDLRRDWIVRQIKASGWACAARVSGMAVGSLRGIFPAALWEDAPQPDVPQTGGDDTEYSLWRIVQQEGSSTAGLAIWMCWKLQMQPGEILALTWDQIDLQTGLIRFPDHDVDMGARTQRLLSDVRARQKDVPTNRVFIAPATGNPIDQSRLSVLCRTAMIRGGLEGFSLRSLSVWAHNKQMEDILLQGAEKQGYLLRDTAASLLHVSPGAAWDHLNRLSKAGRLTRVGVRYYPAGNTVAEADYLPILRAYLQKEGTAGRQALADQLRIAPKQATHILKGMVDRGELVLAGKRYHLPENTP